MNVLICDDSGFARKQLMRALPAGWNVTLHQAADGLEGVEQILMGHGDLIFLDQARAQQAERRLTIVDGWTYFIHGWTQVIAEVFHVGIGTDADTIGRLTDVAQNAVKG